MQQVYGKIRRIHDQERVFEIKVKNRIEYFYLTRGHQKKFKSYIQEDLYVVINFKETRVKRGCFLAHEIINFEKLIKRTNRRVMVYYDLFAIKRGVENLLNRGGYRMFLDMEFTMPPLNHPHGEEFPAEIIQYGMLIEDENGKFVTTSDATVKPVGKEGLNSRTFDFLNIDNKSFKNAQTAKDFYNTLIDKIMIYQPTIFVWGRNDILMLDKFYNLHKFKPITERKNFVNLMQVIKNYYGIKTDIGLFAAYDLFKESNPIEQDHHALNDAIATAEIYHLFKKAIKVSNK